MSDVRRRIFISWSGEPSRRVAATLRDWLPQVIQNTVPFMSEEDIAKGSRGNEAIATELQEAAVGIICLTPQNLAAPWILFEAGALSNSLGAKNLVCPYLIGLQKSDVPPPLSLFQITDGNEQDTFRLLQTINGSFAQDYQLAAPTLARQFKVWWPELGSVLVEAEVATRVGAPAEPIRSQEDILLEVLQSLRRMERQENERAEAIIESYAPLAEAPDLFSAEGSATTFKVGDTVTHRLFGHGVVREIAGFGRDIKIVVDFVGLGRKKLLLRYAGLELMPASTDGA